MDLDSQFAPINVQANSENPFEEPQSSPFENITNYSTLNFDHSYELSLISYIRKIIGFKSIKEVKCNGINTVEIAKLYTIG